MPMSMSIVPWLLFNDDDVSGALAAVHWPIKMRVVSIEFRDVFDNTYGSGGGCPRASKGLKFTDVVAIHNWMATVKVVHNAKQCRFNALVTDFSALAHIHMLALSDLAFVTNAEISAFAHIHTLELINLPLVTDVGITALARVHTLYLAVLPLVTDVGITALARVQTLTLCNVLIN